MKKSQLLSLFLIFCLLLCSCGSTPVSSKFSDTNQTITATIEPNTSNTKNNTPQQVTSSGNLYIHFIDVGQADCILIQLPSGQIMMIDAGNNGDSKVITNYLDSLNIKTIDYLVGTHPHEDHIGSLDTVIDKYNIGKIFMPKASANTKTFEDVLISIQNKNLKVNTPKPGDFIINDTDISLSAEIIAPNGTDYKELNDYSIVIRLVYGNTSFLFTGDAESVSEKEILAKGFDVSTNVLKVGHHGSTSSTSDAFLSAVSPKYAVICCGEGNTYEHPHQETLQKLAGVNIYRLDKFGTVVAISDGINIYFNSKTEIPVVITPKSTEEPTPEPTESPAPTPEPTLAPTPTPAPALAPTDPPVVQSQSVTVYVTKTGAKYHKDGCRYLKQSKIPMDLESAKLRFDPCSVCKPPQ